MKGHFLIFLFSASILVSSCAHKKAEGPTSSIVPQTLVHNLFVETSLGKKAKGRKVASLPEQTLSAQLDQTCAFQFSGKLRADTVKVFQSGNKAIAVGACVAPISDQISGGAKTLPIYGKYRVRNLNVKVEHKRAMTDLLKQKCSMKYKGKLVDQNLLVWGENVEGTYILGECQLPTSTRGISSFDNVSGDEKNF